MTRTHRITINSKSFTAGRGEILLDAALGNGIDLPHQCRAGHCGTCCVRVVSGKVEGGEGAVPGIVHACQCRISGDVVAESARHSGFRTVNGVLVSLRPLSAEVMEAGVRTEHSLPYLPGQFAEVTFSGFPGRPFSLTLPLQGRPGDGSVYFHVRRMAGGLVTSALGTLILPGHPLTLAGPFGSAHFRPERRGRLVLVSTSTGFAPVWSIAAAVLRENPHRRMMVIAGGRSLASLYMAPALVQLAHFPKVQVVPVCSAPYAMPNGVMRGRPTDFLPRLLATDTLYACGAPAMVEATKAIAARQGAACFADPFVVSASLRAARLDRADGTPTSAGGWPAMPSGGLARPRWPERPHAQPPEARSMPGAAAAR